jgi:hypothetical protein
MKLKIIKENFDRAMSQLAEVTETAIDGQFLKQFGFQAPKESDKKQISASAAEIASTAEMGQNDILFNQNNGNISIAVPIGDSSEYEVYVSYAEDMESLAVPFFYDLLFDKLKEMGVKKAGNLPAPMSDTNVEANVEYLKKVGGQAVEAPRTFSADKGKNSR